MNVDVLDESGQGVDVVALTRLCRFVMRRIVARKDPGADLDHGREYTDWPALDGAVDGWLEA